MELAGLHVVVTRAAHQAGKLEQLLKEHGARVTLLPTVDIAPPLDKTLLVEAARALHKFDIVIFTSANAVRALAPHVAIGVPNSVRAAAVGPATSEAARAAGFHVSFEPERYTAEALTSAVSDADLTGKRVLIPSSALARDLVPNELQKLGAEVTVVEAYRNICPPQAAKDAPRVFDEPLPDWVLFASPSAFHNLLLLIGPETLANVRLASIGPTTSAAISSHGLYVAVEAQEQTVESLVNALVATAKH